jgi:chaperonin cofactor prefoldin
VDALTNLAADFLASTGIRIGTALVLVCATVVPAVLISWVILALSRRLDRIEERLMDLRQLHVAMQETQAQHAKLVRSLEAVAAALPDLEGFKQFLRSANGKELISAFSKVSVDVESMRDMVEARLTSLHSNQERIHKVLKAWNSKLKEMGQTVATVPTLQMEQAVLKNEVADWRSRFEAAYDVFAQFMQADGPPADQVAGVDTPEDSSRS